MKDFRNEIALNDLIVHDKDAATVFWKGYEALRLNGLAFVPNFALGEGSVEVYIGSDNASYCGIAYRIKDILNYELSYAQPHTSGRWDALQYDPVFHGINTWQLHHGPQAQQAVEVPMGEWFRLREDFRGKQARIQLNDQTPLLVPRLAHAHARGSIGLWSYLPAYFRDLHISAYSVIDEALGDIPTLVEEDGLIQEWFLNGFGRIESEDSGIVNLNRFLPATTTEACLTRRFVLEKESDVVLHFGFSDEISIRIDGKPIFDGENHFKSSPQWNDQGYVYLDKKTMVSLSAGTHQIEILLKRTEPFGWGLKLALSGENLDLLSCEY